jgi:hypothetical protein
MPIIIRRSRLMLEVVPFVTSVCVHAIILLIGVFTLQTLIVQDVPATQAQSFAPEIEVLSGPRPTATGILDKLPAPLDSLTEVSTIGGDPAAIASERFTSPKADSLDVGNAVPNLIGKPSSASDDRGKVPGYGIGPSGPVRLPKGSGGPGGSVFGGTGTDVVQSVTYVCDASGSMLDKFEPLRQELIRSVGELTPVQSFNVIFFQAEQAAALSTRGLLRGASEQKRRAEQFVQDISPSGPTDPLPALELALRQKPQLIWLLTDGDFPDNAAVLAFIRRHNPGGRVRINTIAFVERGEGYEQVLKTIAAENGGTFRYVGQSESK